MLDRIFGEILDTVCLQMSVLFFHCVNFSGSMRTDIKNRPTQLVGELSWLTNCVGRFLISVLMEPLKFAQNGEVHHGLRFVPVSTY